MHSLPWTGTIGGSTSPTGACGAIFRDSRVMPTASFEIDSLRVSRVALYTGTSFTPPPRDMVSDANTLLLYNFNECPGSTTVSDQGPLARHGRLGIGFGSATSPTLGGTIAPATESACAGTSISFSEPPPPTSGNPYTYLWQWRPLPTVSWMVLADGINMHPLSGEIEVTGSNTHSLLVTPHGIGGTFRCLISNSCGTLVSNPASLSVCLADFNCDGGIDGSDVDAFFALWEAGETAADINLDGGIDGGDIERLLHPLGAGVLSG